MKFTLAWLRDHLDTEATLDEITERLTLIGLEVETVNNPAETLADFEVAEIVEAKPHPEADRLQVCQVKTGAGMTQVVCGAPNARAGLKGILAREGATIPANGLVLGKAKIRGVESRGMMCSGAELNISDDHDGIIELPAGAEVGAPAADILGLNDPVIEIAITPNRPDCLGVRGIARDLAAAGLGTLKEDKITPVATQGDCPISLAVGSGCGVFKGRVIRNVKNGASPDWLQARLKAIGLRPINTLVDITNYISFDRGRPLHVYDLARVTGNMAARAGQDGETFIALDDQEYTVTPEDCVIADEASVLGLGGIMGGKASGCEATTQDVFIESAWFDPTYIALSGRRHGIESDARYRFERGVDPASVDTGLALASAMIVELCGGEASASVTAGAIPDLRFKAQFDPRLVLKRTGVDLDEARMRDILTALGFEVSQDWQIVAPSWRPDITGVVDLVEEIIRIHGLDNVPSTPLPIISPVARPILTDPQRKTRQSRRALAARGLVEAVTWSFVSETYATAFGGDPALRLANPISADLSHMRPSLLPGLLAAVARNTDRGFADFGLFEVGTVFSGPQPGEQTLSAAAVRTGDRVPRDWRQTRAAFDSFDAKADCLAVLSSLGVDAGSLRSSQDVPSYYHPGQSGVLYRDPRQPLAYFGTLHPVVAAELGLPDGLVLCEVFPLNLPAAKARKGQTKPVLQMSNLQAVHRDFAFEVADTVAVEEIIRAAKGADKSLIDGVHVFDVFVGQGVQDGHKSIAIEVTLQPRQATLTDAEIEAVSEKIIDAVAKATAARLRR
jgi:phenylalanyl-tRNA synthetase beta chain